MAARPVRAARVAAVVAPGLSQSAGSPVAVTLPSISAEVTGPGPMFESLMELKPGDDMAHFKYEAHEYFVSGTANGQPYTTRIVMRKPADNAKVQRARPCRVDAPERQRVDVSLHASLLDDAGHIGAGHPDQLPRPVRRVQPRTLQGLRVAQGQAPEILAQVGALIKSKQRKPARALPMRKMILAGTSASAGVLINYLPAHMVLRLADMKPIYDGFLPTSTGATIRQIDVPMIQVPTMTEVTSGNGDRAPGRRRAGEPVPRLRVRRAWRTSIA